MAVCRNLVEEDPGAAQRLQLTFTAGKLDLTDVQPTSRTEDMLCTYRCDEMLRWRFSRWFVPTGVCAGHSAHISTQQPSFSLLLVPFPCFAFQCPQDAPRCPNPTSWLRTVLQNVRGVARQRVMHNQAMFLLYLITCR